MPHNEESASLVERCHEFICELDIGNNVFVLRLGVRLVENGDEVICELNFGHIVFVF